MMSNIDSLIDLMSKLRDPVQGCPWDLKQSIASLLPHTLEEVYEVADAIESGSMVELEDELGDLLFQIVFYAQLAREGGSFDFDDIAAGVTKKLLRRHPHGARRRADHLPRAQPPRRAGPPITPTRR